ncbi:uncharacterized protein PRCAT00005827001 [Priceomyces carsonii]|uniref:uncharacterized protein n=1 Tax=Priceomyces carsonii TaxID=28549 RepID=UPI002ED9A830|nr:unnamed protein product [Priceomyces carsonii]
MKGSFSPFGENDLLTRHDVQKACLDLFCPLIEAFSPGCARVRLDESAAVFDQAASDLEGFARPLWGICSLVAGEGEFPYWEIYRKGLSNGTNPTHKEYWGDPSDRDQRMVEFAAIGFALAMVPEHVWYPLDPESKSNLLNYLLRIRKLKFTQNNWMMFRVLIDLGLKKINHDNNDSLSEEYLEKIESFSLKDGWYGDGSPCNIDHYNAFAFHFYSILYCKFNPQDASRCERFITRSHQFALQYIHLFDAKGASLPIGRSLVYRFATASFWGCLGLLGESEVSGLNWGVIKGLYMRNLRWWAQRPISRYGSNILTKGYSYPQDALPETYSSSQSPYWAMKAFIALSIPANHPFWTSKEEPYPKYPNIIVLSTPGMVISQRHGNNIALVSGPCQESFIKSVKEKYCKFVYSTRYGFNIEGLNSNSFDSSLGVSIDGGQNFEAKYKGNSYIFEYGTYSQWSPHDGVAIESWVIFLGDWHLRAHKVSSERKLNLIEGGFPIDSTDGVENIKAKLSCDLLEITNGVDISIIADLYSNRGCTHSSPEPNTNILKPLVTVPQLKGSLREGVSWIMGAFLGIPKGVKMTELPLPPTIQDLERYRDSAMKVGCSQ